MQLKWVNATSCESCDSQLQPGFKPDEPSSRRLTNDSSPTIAIPHFTPQPPNPATAAPNARMSLRIVPAEEHTSSFSHIGAREKGAPSAPGVHDLLRRGVGPTAAPGQSDTSSSSATTAPDSAHPLEARLRQWEATREALRMESLRRAFGVAEPVRRGMELKITREGEWRPLVLGGEGGSSSQLPSVHEDILRGRDTTIDWEDIYTGETMRAVPTFHEEMERKLNM